MNHDPHTEILVSTEVDVYHDEELLDQKICMSIDRSRGSGDLPLFTFIWPAVSYIDQKFYRNLVLGGNEFFNLHMNGLFCDYKYEKLQVKVSDIIFYPRIDR